ncbi:uncharacterized protein RAG0_11124 [Rhynchosporium agropyri]|uniref:EGF-like domain-containing protein n=1 Tax=Rhynchosporium agropyri TaxID=914238 RepID=A0A1E1L5A0_9HELO|nr:uncharacterized protein RAG0_11124 [Rhynchosporium agropyri]
MNQPWQPPSRTPGGNGEIGSVRAARERMAAGLPPVMPQPQPRRLYDPPQLAPQAAPVPIHPANRMRPPMPEAFSGPKNGQAPVGAATSRPTLKQQVPQWPLAGSVEPGQQYQPPVNQGPPPQRPPRPSQVPTASGISRLKEGLRTAEYVQRQEQLDREYQYERERREEEEMISPDITSPLTMSSRQSSQSSAGSIPDFPVPVLPPPPRSFGPPPSSRRGASSYYSQASFVSPIPEESPRSRQTHFSYASSAAIPTSWGSNSPRSQYFDDKYEDESIYDGEFDRSPMTEESRGTRGFTDDNDDRELIRSASFGRRAKPSMITTRSSERLESRPAPMPQQRPIQMSKLEKMGVIPRPGNEESGATSRNKTGSEATDQHMQKGWPIIGDATSPLAIGTGLIDKSTSSSEETVPTLARAITTNTATPAQTTNLSNPNTKAMLGAYNSASSLRAPGTESSRTPSPSNGFDKSSAIRRPPRLDIDAVREAEARGSLTSLPDLIRRATRLASMIDRGKRPGSRLALNDFPSEDNFAREKEMGMSNGRQSGFSGMLASFPPPGDQTPVGTPTHPTSGWPTQMDTQAGDEKKQQKPRRCCGLPCWGFMLMVLIILIIVAAAVVVPLEFLVLNKPNSTRKAVTAAQCQSNTVTACQNGGTALVESRSCACICTNGFTGSTCTSPNANGCATVTMSGSSFSNVTVGHSISRLIEAGPTNFSIPLSESIILARFNSANLSCATENALVTFQGRSERLGKADNLISFTTTSASAKAKNARRDESTSVTSSLAPVATSHGIVYDGSRPASSSPPKDTNPTSNTDGNSDATSGFKITEEVLDFARIAILYVLQQDALEDATTAQSTLQTWFLKQGSTNQAAMNVSMGHGNVVNLVAFQVDVGGTGFVGGRNSSLTVRDLDVRDLVLDLKGDKEFEER